MTSFTSTRLLLNDSQFVRCVPLSQEEEELLRGEAAQKRYRFFAVDLADTQTPEDLMKRMARALSFPSYFGGNWDAFLDMVTDLSWNPAPGYVVLLRNAAALLQLPSEQLAIFVRLCSAAVERWQSGEDEEGKTIPRTPFYFLLEGQAPFCRLIADLLTSGNP
jgi:hypothetical protein